MAKYLDDLEAVTTAIAQPSRRQILARLSIGVATSSELADLTGIGLPTIAKHIGVLARAGLVDSRKTGRIVTHRLQPQGFDDLQAWIAARTSFWNDRLDALEHHLEER